MTQRPGTPGHGDTNNRKEASAVDGAAAQIAAKIRLAMKAQSLSGREVARRVERLTGLKYLEVYVSRRLHPTRGRPVISISEDFWSLAKVAGLDPHKLLMDAILAIETCPSCGSPSRGARWKLDPEAYGIITCQREFHDNATCAKQVDAGKCGEPITYVTSSQLERSGWYHVDRTVTDDHHAIPPSLTR